MQPNVQHMSVNTALALRTLEGYTYCLDCGDEDNLVRCIDSGEHRYAGDAEVSALMEIKRREEWRYKPTLTHLRLSGQIEPIEICEYGTCLHQGHHRIAAAQDLSWEQIAWTVSKAPCLYEGHGDL